MTVLHYARDGGNYHVFVNWLDPSGGDFYGQDGTGVSAPSGVTCEGLDPAASTPAAQVFAPTAMTFDSSLRMWKLTRPSTDLDARRVIAFRFVPTTTVSGALIPKFTRPVSVTDALKRQDELESAIATRAAPGAAMSLVADAVSATTLAASAVTEVQAAILSDATPFPGARIDALVSSRATPADVTAARDSVNANVDAAETLLASGIASVLADTNVIESIVSVRLDVAVSTRATPADVSASTSSVLAGVSLTRSDVLAAVDAVPTAAELDAQLSSTHGSGPWGAGGAASPSDIAAAVWGAALPGAYAAGTAGERLASTDDRVDVAVSSRAAAGDAMTLTTGARDALVDAIWDEAIAGHLSAGSTGAALAGGGAAAQPVASGIPPT